MDPIAFWETTLRPLFSKRCFEFQVELLDGSRVRYVNLDHAATTPPFLEVKEYMDEWFDTYGSVHRGTGQKSVLTTTQYDDTRPRIRQYVNAGPDDYVLFSKNTTEAINQAATLWASIPGKILVSDIEHSSNLLPWVKHNAVIQYRTSREGMVDVAEIDRVLAKQAALGGDERIKLVTFTACSNITGYSPPIYEIARLAHKHGALVLADVCQHIPHEPVDMLPASDPAHLDFLAFSGHKMYAPYGIGVLIGPKTFFDGQLPYHIGGGNLPYITRDLQMKRYVTERAHDPGTPNAMGPIALSKAMDVLERIGRDRVHQYEHALMEYAFDCMSEIRGITMYVRRDLLGHVIPFDLDGFDSRLLAAVLAVEFGVGMRSGAFCTYEYIRKLKGISDADDQRIARLVDEGRTRDIPHIARASFSIANPFSDCDRLVAALKEVAARGFDHYAARYDQDQKTGSWTIRAKPAAVGRD